MSTFSADSLRRHRTQSDTSQHPLLAEWSQKSFGDLEGLQKEELRQIKRRQATKEWTLDRGTGFYQEEREKHHRPFLVETGRHAGKSNFQLDGIEWIDMMRHVLKRDFFITIVHRRLPTILLGMICLYVATFFFWATLYYLSWRFDAACFTGFNGFRSAFSFAIETQQTIGYGGRAVGDCWLSSWIVALHSMTSLAMESIFFGVIFAKIAHPKHRGRTLLISDSACIARRDGVLKLMFRIADINSRSVLSPLVKVQMYTWDANHCTAEGEHIPVRVEQLHIHNMDTVLLLPAIVEHNIDETSPLFGHTHKTLKNVEIIVTFEGTNELGDAFMARQSYLAAQIHWGHVFVNIISPASEGSTSHRINLAKFHDVEPQPQLTQALGIMLPSNQLARWVLQGGSGTTPAPSLGENTLALSDSCCIAPRQGQWCLMFRVGDTLPGHMLNVHVQAILYRWSTGRDRNADSPFEMKALTVTPAHPMLRLPQTIAHVLDASSPLHAWTTHDGLMADADAEVVVLVEATCLYSGQLVVKSHIYNALSQIHMNTHFAPCVVPPSQSYGGRPQIVWNDFHRVCPLDAEAASRLRAARPHASNAGGSNHGGISAPSLQYGATSPTSAGSTKEHGAAPERSSTPEQLTSSSVQTSQGRHTLLAHEVEEQNMLTVMGGRKSSSWKDNRGLHQLFADFQAERERQQEENAAGEQAIGEGDTLSSARGGSIIAEGMRSVREERGDFEDEAESERTIHIVGDRNNRSLPQLPSLASWVGVFSNLDSKQEGSVIEPAETPQHVDHEEQEPHFE